MELKQCDVIDRTGPLNDHDRSSHVETWVKRSLGIREGGLFWKQTHWSLEEEGTVV